LDAPECAAKKPAGKARRRRRAIPWKEEQRRQPAFWPCTRVRSALTQKARARNTANTECRVVFMPFEKRPTEESRIINRGLCRLGPCSILDAPSQSLGCMEVLRISGWKSKGLSEHRRGCGLLWSPAGRTSLARLPVTAMKPRSPTVNRWFHGRRDPALRPNPDCTDPGTAAPNQSANSAPASLLTFNHGSSLPSIAIDLPGGQVNGPHSATSYLASRPEEHPTGSGFRGQQVPKVLLPWRNHGHGGMALPIL